MGSFEVMNNADIWEFGARITTVEKRQKWNKNGETRIVKQGIRYRISKGMAEEEIVIFEGRKKIVSYKPAVKVKDLYPCIKHVYNSQGVLIGRRNNRNQPLKFTAKGMGYLAKKRKTTATKVS